MPEPAAIDLWEDLARGGWLGEAGRIDLRGFDGALVDNPLLWSPLPVVPQDGWDRAGRGWRPIGQRAVLEFWRRGSEPTEMIFDLRNRTSPDLGQAIDVGVELNGRVVAHHRLEPGRKQLRVAIPDGQIGSRNEIVLSFSPPLVIEEASGHPIALLGVGFSSSEDNRDRSRDPGAEVLSGSRAVRISGRGTYVVNLADLDRQHTISFRLSRAAESTATAQVDILDFEGRIRHAASASLEPGVSEDFTVELQESERHGSTLLIHTEPARTRGGLEIDRLVARTGGLETTEPPAISQSSEGNRLSTASSDSHPDVILIILDAARGDRFPGWDYHRQTMPNIDRFAKDALAFRNAFAECPTTSCSIPALLTGVSLLEGGQVGKGQKLSEQLTTLAEYLHDKGYRTVGFSATPNNSASRNMDQGFDLFRELWGKDNPDHGPFNMSRLAIEQIESQPKDEPLYLQLHYLPPHQPYDPGSEFDRFTQPDYDGPIWPKMSLKPYSLGRASLEPEDLAHLIGLYDGNLLRADAAVAQLLAALGDAGRLDDAIVILTSDHGEAFMEHGYQGHNTTLYDEMLHVPLIVRPPGGVVGSDLNIDGLASLLDVVPTVLGRLGIAAAPEVDGWDLLGVDRVRAETRHLVMRTSHAEQPMIAVRTSRWKSISWPKHQLQMLFDLHDDPGERQNRVGERPFVFTRLGLISRQRLQQALGVRFRGEGVELDPEAEEALRSLGYLD